MTVMKKPVLSRRDFLRLSGAFTASLAVNGCSARSLFVAKNIHRPNILFIFADDQTYEAIHALGSGVQTPNLDRLAKRGVTFTHCYNQGAWSGAICVASRTMLNTGRFLWNAEALNKTLDGQRDAGRFWSQYIKQAGYDTYFSGKWHVSTDVNKLFDVVKDVRPGMAKDVPTGYDRPYEGKPDPWKPWDKSLGGYWQGGKHWSEALADDGVEFIEQAADRKNPFFMYLAFNAPHDPRQSPKEYVDKYPLDKIEVPANFLPEYPFKDSIGCSEKLRDERLAPFPRTEYAVKVHRQEYYALITHMDAQIGRMLDAIESAGLDKTTYIFFTADNGLALGHHGLFGKQSMYEHSMRVPLIATGPGIGRGKIESPVYLQDIMPTSLELAGIKKPDYVQFESLLPVMRGQADSSYDAIYGAYLDLQRMAVCDGYKIILYPAIKKVLLYNLRQDPDEMTDLAGRPRYRKVEKKLFGKLLKLQKDTGDKLDIRSVYPELAD